MSIDAIWGKIYVTDHFKSLLLVFQCIWVSEDNVLFLFSYKIDYNSLEVNLSLDKHFSSFIMCAVLFHYIFPRLGIALFNWVDLI